MNAVERLLSDATLYIEQRLSAEPAIRTELLAQIVAGRLPNTVRALNTIHGVIVTIGFAGPFGEQERTMSDEPKEKPEHPEHPHGGPPGQTGENPGHGGQPPGQADKPAEPELEPKSEGA